LKNEMFYGHEDEFKTLDELKQAIEEYIEYYNTKRINLKRKGLSPLAWIIKFNRGLLNRGH
ncbi:IS3 family transposase, partial [Floccifex sp.]|uniref:IS3 family transposase n=1 Tax=Floccifex sp. TaxID=2815810 RepID=UPI002A74C387